MKLKEIENAEKLVGASKSSGSRLGMVDECTMVLRRMGVAQMNLVNEVESVQEALDKAEGSKGVGNVE